MRVPRTRPRLGVEQRPAICEPDALRHPGQTGKQGGTKRPMGKVGNVVAGRAERTREAQDPGRASVTAPLVVRERATHRGVRFKERASGGRCHDVDRGMPLRQARRGEAL